jgi:hypothetical protein
MSTMHAALIDYRFRMLPTVSQSQKGKKGGAAGDFEKIDMDSYFDLED